MEKTTCMNLRKMVDNHTFITPLENKMGYDVLYGKLSETWEGCNDRSILRLNSSDLSKMTVKDFTVHLLLRCKHVRETFAQSNCTT